MLRLWFELFPRCGVLLEKLVVVDVVKYFSSFRNSKIFHVNILGSLMFPWLHGLSG